MPQFRTQLSWAVVWVCVMLALLPACVSDDNAFDDLQQSISFSPVIHSTQTRAGANEFDTASDFGAYAWLGTSDVEIHNDVYIDNKQVTFNGQHWAPTTPSYWPGFGYLDFFCYSPYSSAGTQPTVTVTADYRQNRLEYKDVVANASTPDYMYSQKAINQNKNTSAGGQGVSIIFNHALAKVKVSIRINTVDDGKGKTWKVELKQFNITSITNKGGVELKLHDQKINWMKPNPAVWTESPGAKENWNLLPSAAADRTLTTTSPKVLKETFVIPQELEDGMKLTIAYDLLTTENGVTNRDSKTMDLALNTIQSTEGPILRWEMNKVISYNVVINPPSTRKPLQFAPTVEDWLNNNSSVEVNPK